MEEKTEEELKNVLYFRGKLHRLDEKDYRLIESRMRRLSRDRQEEE